MIKIETTKHALAAVLLVFALFAAGGCTTCPFCGSELNGKDKTAPVFTRAADLRRLLGTVSCIERVAILPTFEVKVRLVRIDTENLRPFTLAEQTIKDFKEFPVAFSLEYDHSLIEGRGTYGLVAELTSQGTVLFSTDTQYKVLAGGGEKTDLVIMRVN